LSHPGPRFLLVKLKVKASKIKSNPIEILGLVASLLAATLYQLRNIKEIMIGTISSAGSTNRYIIYIQGLLECCYI
jgi:hypothetical protein